MPITILVAENHTIVLKGICSFLSNQKGIKIIGEANTAKEAIGKANELRPDILIMNDSLSIIDMVESARWIKKNLPDIKIVILTTHKDEHEYLRQLLQAQANAYVSKSSSEVELLSALFAVQNNKTFLCSFFSKALVENVCKHESLDSYEQLTVREKTILQLAGKGLSNKQIAKQLDCSSNTVKNHKSSLMNKLKIHDTSGLILYSIRKGLVKP